MIAYVFNPEHDLALASRELRFQPPSMARRMREELAALPVWWVEPTGERVLIPVASIALTRSWADGMTGLPQVEWMSFRDASVASSVGEVRPWGWDMSLRYTLMQWGVSADVLPGEGALEEIRRWSSRELAVEMLHRFRSASVEVPLCGESVFCRSDVEVECALERWGSCILKAPWSGSGKGLRLAPQGSDAPLVGWYRRVLQKQQGVVVEPFLRKVQDFALEYFALPSGEIRYEGVSVFMNTTTGAYAGNRIAGEASNVAYLAERAGVQVDVFMGWLREIVGWHVDALGALIGGRYVGPLGIDMMLCMEAHGVAIHPCVEMNLRCTMGWVALQLYRRLQREGTFMVECHPEAYEHHIAALRNPGYIALTPVVSGQCYRAYFQTLGT
jgi:hypothetical protein